MAPESATTFRKIDCLSAARGLFEPCFASGDRARETLWVAHLNHAAVCVHLSRHDGDETGALFPMKTILRDALAHDSAGLLLAHNHPSGEARPSHSDCRATRRLASVLDSIDCALVDHLIFAGTDCASFRQLGLL